MTAQDLRKIADKTSGVDAARMRWFASLIDEGKAVCRRHPDRDGVLSFQLHGAASRDYFESTGAHVPIPRSRKAPAPLTLRNDGPAFLAQRLARDVAEAKSRLPGSQLELAL